MHVLLHSFIVVWQNSDRVASYLEQISVQIELSSFILIPMLHVSGRPLFWAC